jgi:hypothetical protein
MLKSFLPSKQAFSVLFLFFKIHIILLLILPERFHVPTLQSYAASLREKSSMGFFLIKKGKYAGFGHIFPAL